MNNDKKQKKETQPAPQTFKEKTLAFGQPQEEPCLDGSGGTGMPRLQPLQLQQKRSRQSFQPLIRIFVEQLESRGGAHCENYGSAIGGGALPKRCHTVPHHVAPCGEKPPEQDNKPLRPSGLQRVCVRCHHDPRGGVMYHAQSCPPCSRAVRNRKNILELGLIPKRCHMVPHRVAPIGKPNSTVHWGEAPVPICLSVSDCL